MEATNLIKAEVEKNVSRLAQLRDEVKLKLHLASLEAKSEWEEKLEPRVHEVEQTAKNVSDTSRNAVGEVVQKLEDFLHRLNPSTHK
jgi:hypothetical protein